MYVVPPPSEPPASQSRVYQEWKGNNVFILSGRLIFGPDALSLLATIVLIVAPTSVFCVFVARKLIDEFPNHGGDAIMVIVPSLAVIDLAFLLLTAGRDPGIIPRNTHPPEPEIIEGQPEGQTPPIRLPRTKNVIVNGIVVKSKYCDTCMLYRPPRCSHCSICNNCVQKFDHHCPWVGQCIGLRNYRFYFMFVSLSTTLCLLIHSFCWVYIKKIMNSEHKSVWRAMIRTPASIALILYTFFAFWFVGGLTVFHLYLISKNQSTYENFRYRYEGVENPFDIGTLRNFADVFFSKIPPSKNNFRAKAPIEASPMRRMKSGASYGYSERGWRQTNEGFEEFDRKDSGLDKEAKIGSESADLRHTTHSRRSSLGRDNPNCNLSADINAESGSIGNSIRMILDDDNLKSRARYDQD